MCDKETLRKLMDEAKIKSSKRQRVDKVKHYRCKYLIAVVEDPHDINNIGTMPEMLML